VVSIFLSGKLWTITWRVPWDKSNEFFHDKCLLLNFFFYFHQAMPTAITEPTPSEAKLADLTLIEKRLDNWFVKQSQSSVQFTGNVKKRWVSLQVNVEAASTELATLNINKDMQTGVITGRSNLCWELESRCSCICHTTFKILEKIECACCKPLVCCQTM